MLADTIHDAIREIEQEITSPGDPYGERGHPVREMVEALLKQMRAVQPFTLSFDFDCDESDERFRDWMENLTDRAAAYGVTLPN